MSGKKAKILLSFMLAVIALSALAGISYTFFPSQQETASGHMPLGPTASPPYSTPPSMPISVDLSPDAENGVYTASRGESISLEFILTSYSDETQYSVPLYLAIASFENPELQKTKFGFKVLATPSGEYSSQLPWPSELIEQSNDSLPFSATFDTNPLTIKPMGKTVSRLTLEVAENATTGIYLIIIDLDDWQQWHMGDSGFQVKVEP